LVYPTAIGWDLEEKKQRNKPRTISGLADHTAFT